MRIFGPLVCSTTFADTVADARASAAVVRSSPSTSSTGTSEISSPGAPSSFSTVTTSSTATLYCLPPVLTIAYIADARLLNIGGAPGALGLSQLAPVPGAHTTAPVPNTVVCRGVASVGQGYATPSECSPPGSPSPSVLGRTRRAGGR